MQVLDESRHFLRTVQFAQGDWIASIDAKTKLAGGVLPDAVLDFVRQTMNTNFLQEEGSRRTIQARLHGLDQLSAAEPPLSHTRFGAFPTPAIYPPALYIPQILGVEAAQLFTSKVYLWLYCARVFNAVICVLLIFVSLVTIGPQRSPYLIIPAMLPMSLYQLGSASSDASVLALSMLFIALCVRFCRADSRLMRPMLVTCLTLLVLGKPVHIVFALLLLTAHKRLGWRRAARFCLAASAVACTCYLLWSYCVRRFLALAGEGNGQQPAAQISFVAKHPLTFIRAVLVTLHHGGLWMAKQFLGMFGWGELPLPPWFEWISFLIIASILILVVANYKKINLPEFAIGFLTMSGLAAAIFLAGYVLWNPPAARSISLMQGRYFIPGFTAIAILSPPLTRFRPLSKWILVGLCLGFAFLCTCTTVRIADHYFFPRSELLGRNIHDLFQEAPAASCPASIEYHGNLGAWFQIIETGRTFDRGDYRVLFATEDGVILSESDPALTGDISQYVLGLVSHGFRWRINLWRQNKAVRGNLWLVQAGRACPFGPNFVFSPYDIPDAKDVPVNDKSTVILE